MMMRQVRAVLNDIFECAYDENICGFETHESLAAAAGLAPMTVRNLFNKVTVEPRASTVFKLAKAVGADLSIVQDRLMKQRRRKAA